MVAGEEDERRRYAAVEGLARVSVSGRVRDAAGSNASRVILEQSFERACELKKDF